MPISDTPVKQRTVRIYVKRGAYLRNPAFSTLCPKISINYGGNQAHTITLQDAGSAPTWPEAFFDFPFCYKTKEIEFQLFHDDMRAAKKKEKLMADVKMDLKETLGFDKHFDGSFNLYKDFKQKGCKKPAGNLYVCMEIVEPVDQDFVQGIDVKVNNSPAMRSSLTAPFQSLTTLFPRRGRQRRRSGRTSWGFTSIKFTVWMKTS